MAGATCRIHFKRVTATVGMVTAVAGLPTASVAFTVTETVPVPSVVVVNVAVAKFAGKRNVPVGVSNLTVHVEVLPAMVHVPEAGPGPLPLSVVPVESLSVKTSSLVSPARRKCLPSWPQKKFASEGPAQGAAPLTG